jgi:two-component system, NarL family, invasion response regulator UvrY
MIRVLIADDHPLVRSGLRHVLSREQDFAPPGEAKDAEELLTVLKEQGWDALVLDIAMPGPSGLESLAEIRRLFPDLPVLILSVFPEELFAVRAIRSGASGYLTKSDAPSELVKAIRCIVGGKKYVSAVTAEALANVVRSGTNKISHELLSDREFQVMRRIAAGKTVSEIATEIGLSVKTVSTYRARALEKLNMRTNSQFTEYAIRSGLVG